MKNDFLETLRQINIWSRLATARPRPVDADWNEQTAIVLHYLRTLAADLIRPFARPRV
jgi:hypothetical protein